MRDMDGLAGLRQMVSQCSGRAPVAVIGPNCRRQDIRDFLAAGASGYLTYSLSADALLAAFMLLNVGEQYVPAEMFDQEEQTGLNQDGWLTNTAYLPEINRPDRRKGSQANIRLNSSLICQISFYFVCYRSNHQPQRGQPELRYPPVRQNHLQRFSAKSGA